LVVLAVGMPRYWSRPDPRFGVVLSLWVQGDALWRGYVRAMPTMVIGLGLVIAFAAYMLVVGPPRVRADVFWVWFVLLLASLSALVTIPLFNRPRVLVPPYLRAEPGAIGARGEHGSKVRAGR
jgi:hypothetical protein